MTRDETKEISFADDGTPSAFERLCLLRRAEVRHNEKHLHLDVGALYFDMPLTTDSGDPIDFHIALELASAQLLARLEQ